MARLRFDDWDDVVAFACALPDVEMLPFHATPCPKLNGKPLAAPGRAAGSFAVMCRPEDKEMLLETDPDIFWQTPSYESRHALFVRFGSGDPERVALVLRRAWWDRARRAQRQAFGARP